MIRVEAPLLFICHIPTAEIQVSCLC